MHFEICPPEVLYSFGAYGMPTRFGHWSFGKAYQRIKAEYDHNLSRMYEMVINTDPCYAFLLQGNSRVQNRLVIAHILAHSDFFKHNAYFARTVPRTVLDSMAAAAGRFRGYEEAYGRDRVEQFLDAALAVAEHVDYRGHPAHAGRAGAGEPAGRPENDLPGFIARFGHGLESWQRDVLAVIREESLYFRPQLATKLCNEGWATFWHLKIMRLLDLTEEETVDFARMHAQLVQPSRLQINPYLLGLSIFADIDRRWGRDAVFEARVTSDDAGFLRNHLTEELVREMGLFVFRRIGYEWRAVEKDWRVVRDTLVQNLFNCGHPYILVETGDFNGRGELYLKHHYEGVELDVHYLEKTLPLVHRLWGRPVHLETVLEEKEMLFSFVGDKISKRLI
jgi:stage V sporulation protein R